MFRLTHVKSNMAASPTAELQEYFCINVSKSGGKSVDKRVIKLPVGQLTLAEVARQVGLDCQSVMVSAAENDKSATTTAELSTPTSVLHSFGWRVINFYILEDLGTQTNQSSHEPTAFSVMMQARKNLIYPEKKPETRADFKLYNDILGIFSEKCYGFIPDNINQVAPKVLNAITGAIWYMDPHHPKLTARGYHLAGIFSHFPDKQYYDHKTAKKSAPRIDHVELKKHIDNLSDLLLMPWTSKYPELLAGIDKLMEYYHKYWMFLVEQQERSQQRHESPHYLRSPDTNFSLKTIPAVQEITEAYAAVEELLKAADLYQPINADQFCCSEDSTRYETRKWLERFETRVPVQMYTYYQGNYLGNVVCLWRIPEQPESRTEEAVLKAIQHIHTELPKYATRMMKRRFFERYSTIPSLQPAVLRDIFGYLTGDAGAAETASQAEVDSRMMAFLETDDPSLVVDLRKLNGSPGNTTFSDFWKELDSYFNEQMLAVQERRHGEHLYLPFAISVESLVETISKRLPDNAAIPSVEWVRLQFWPTNSTTKRALQHTGKFEVKFRLQSRQIRGQHEDNKYVLKQIAYTKEMAVQWREHVLFCWADDKAIVPCGEPDKPVGTGVRPQNRSLAPLHGPSTSSLDHDFHTMGIIPSALLKTDIPESASDTFFQGDSWVIVKDKVFEPSHAMRHGTELTSLIRQHYSEDGVQSDFPIMIELTDGGPDHRTTFGSVQVAHLAKFILLDLDMMIAVRTSPMGSWANLAERLNSVLNLALQNVALARERMEEDMEKIMKRLSTLQDVRTRAARNPNLKEGLISSMSPVLEQLKARFAQLKVKGAPVQVHKAATQQEIEEFFSTLSLVDDQLHQDKLTQKDLKKSERLTDFMEKHCRLRQYTFQIKKCSLEDVDRCWFCTFQPPRLCDELYRNLHFLPDPVFNEDTGAYKNFDQVYGTHTTEAARPSLVSHAEKHCKVDADNRSLLVAAKVRSIISCAECNKPRCVYSATILKPAEKTVVALAKEEGMYSCGSPLLPPTSAQHSAIVVRQGLHCSSPIETQYYGATAHKFPDVCYHCGTKEDMAGGDDIQELQRQYTTVRPICCGCMAGGKEPAVRGQKNVGKRQRRK